SLAEDWVVVLACSWSLPLSVGLAFRVFDDVGASAGRELGRLAGRCRCRWCVPQECSMTWVWLLAEVWVAAWPVRAPCLGVTRPASPECASPQCWGLVCGGRCVACSWTTCGRCGCRWRGLSACSSMFEGVGGCAGRRLGRLGCLLVGDFCVFT